MKIQLFHITFMAIWSFRLKLFPAVFHDYAHVCFPLSCCISYIFVWLHFFFRWAYWNSFYLTYLTFLQTHNLHTHVTHTRMYAYGACGIHMACHMNGCGIFNRKVYYVKTICCVWTVCGIIRCLSTCWHAQCGKTWLQCVKEDNLIGKKLFLPP